MGSQNSRTLGSMLIVAGTAIGAGMLALPITSAGFGFYESIALLAGMWVVMYCAALVILELTMTFGVSLSLSSLFEKVLGAWGKNIAAVSFVVLHYALLAAYITGGSAILHGFLTEHFQVMIPAWVTTFAFLFFFGGFIYACVRTTDIANRVLFIIKIGVFVVMVMLLFPSISTVNFSSQTHDVSRIWIALPVFFTSFGFHGSLPSIISYIGNNPREIKKSLLLGSMIPLFVYFIWQTSSLGVLPEVVQAKLSENTDVADFVQGLIQNGGGGAILGLLANVFAFFAITTSFLGVGLAVFDYVGENLPSCSIGSKLPCKVRQAILSFVPPLVFALFYPKGFIIALGFAGIALSILSLILPSLSLFILRLKKKTNPDYIVPLPNWVLLAFFILGVGIIVIELGKRLF
jgi:tyrosine-specific transport protein